MNQSKFKEIEEKYNELKENLNYGILNPEDVKEELKKMMILDEEGKYWMIGAKTGKWYTHDGTEWMEGNPYKKEQEAEESEDINGTISLSLPGTDSAERERSQEEDTTVKVEPLEDESEKDILAADKEETGGDVIHEEPGEGILEEKEEEAPVKVEMFDDKAGEDILVGEEEAFVDVFQKEAADDFHAKEEEAPVKVEMFDDRAGEDILVEKEEEAIVDVIQKEAADDFHAKEEEVPVKVEVFDDKIGKDILVEEEETPVKVEMFDDKAGEDILLEKKEEDKIEPYTKEKEITPPRKAVKTRTADIDIKKRDELVIVSIKVIPLIFFLGYLGFIVGMLLGAAFGVFKTILPTLQEPIPDILNDLRGKTPGGLVFAAIGGIGGILISAVVAIIISSTYKIIASIGKFGCITLKIK